MPCSEKEKLLNDLLRDANYEAFRKEVYELSAAEFRSKRQPQTSFYLALAASIALAGTLVVLAVRLNKPTEVPVPSAVTFQNDRLPVIDRVQTSRLETMEVVRSVADHKLIVTTRNHRRDAVEFIVSDAATVERVNDSELLALFPDETLGFVTTPQGKKLVVFAEPGRKIELPFAKTVTR